MKRIYIVLFFIVFTTIVYAQQGKTKLTVSEYLDSMFIAMTSDTFTIVIPNELIDTVYVPLLCSDPWSIRIIKVRQERTRLEYSGMIYEGFTRYIDSLCGECYELTPIKK